MIYARAVTILICLFTAGAAFAQASSADVPSAANSPTDSGNVATDDSAPARDWSTFPVPAEAGVGHVWALDEDLSRDFNAPTLRVALHRHWKPRYHNGWSGPGLSIFSSRHTSVENGHLIIHAERAPAGRVFCGVATTRRPVLYPIFMEARIRVSGLKLSSNFWLLSGDDEQELDIVECYGDPREPQGRYFGSNYHFFVRNPDDNEIISDHHQQMHHHLADDAPYHDDFHRFGAYWRDPWHIEFYLDGELIRTLTRDNIDDPYGRGLDRPMHIILDTEDHDWRSRRGIVVSDEDLANDAINRMRVDWVRVYRPVGE